MHGLTGGSWKRGDLTTAAEKNDPTGNRPVTAAPRPTARQRHRASSRPSVRDLCCRGWEPALLVSNTARWPRLTR
jgi:hypothetical protein